MTRYLALDAFRGFTVALMILVNMPGSWAYVYTPLLHAPWHGCTLADLVFPFFLFIIGSAMYFSFQNRKVLTKTNQLNSIIKRGFTLFSIGLILSTIPFDTPIEEVRIMGVLQRIGVAYIIAGSLTLLLTRCGIFIASTIILLAYWAVLLSVAQGGLTLENNIVRQVDLAILGANHMYAMRGVIFEPEGILSTFPAVVNILFGFELTRYLTSIKDKKSSVIKLLMIGGSTILLGVIWGELLPINKALWTSSYVIYTTGFACLLLALFVWLIDIKEYKKLVAPLLVYGSNPLFIFVLSFTFVTFYLNIPVGNLSLYAWLYQQFTSFTDPIFASFLFAVSHIVLFWFISLKLYQRKIFVKI